MQDLTDSELFAIGIREDDPEHVRRDLEIQRRLFELEKRKAAAQIEAAEAQKSAATVTFKATLWTTILAVAIDAVIILGGLAVWLRPE